MNTPSRKNVCLNTGTNCEICSRFKRTALEHIRISQLLLGVQFGNLNMYFQTGLNLTSYEFICRSNIYIYIYIFSIIEIVHLELYVELFKYPANIYLFKLNKRHVRTKCGMYSILVIKTTERRHSRRSGVFIVNFEHI